MFLFFVNQNCFQQIIYVFMSTFDHLEILDSRAESSLQNYATVFFIELDQNKINHNCQYQDQTWVFCIG